MYELVGAVGGATSNDACTVCSNTSPNHTLAGQLDCSLLGCLPGHRRDETDGTCAICGAGQYSDGGQCVDCSEGKYRTADHAGDCLVCPAGSTSQPGATSLADCICLPGLIKIEWKDATPTTRTQHTSSSLGSSTTYASLRQEVWRCIPCGPGRFVDPATSTCNFCPLGQYSTGWSDDGLCTSCPAGSTTTWVSSGFTHAEWTYMEGLQTEPQQRFVRRQNYDGSPVLTLDPTKGQLASGIAACYCTAGYAGEITRANHTCSLCGPGEYGVTGRALTISGQKRSPISPVLGKADPARLPRDGQSTCTLCERGRYKGSSGSVDALVLAPPRATDCTDATGQLAGESPEHYTSTQTGSDSQNRDPCYRAVTILAGSYDRLGGEGAPEVHDGPAATRLHTGDDTPLVVSFDPNSGYPAAYWDGSIDTIVDKPHGCATKFITQHSVSHDNQWIVSEWEARFNKNENPGGDVVPDPEERLVCAMDLIPEMSHGTGNGQKIFSPQLLSAWGQCRPCPPNTETVEPGADDITQCVCKPGTYGTVDHSQSGSNPFFKLETNGGAQVLVPSCMACPAGQFSVAGSTNCTACPIARYASPPRSAMDLDPIWGTALEMTSYVTTLKPDYPLAKAFDIGVAECSACPEHSTTGNVTGADSHTDCRCEPGYHGAVDNPDSLCRPCPIGRFGLGGLLDGQERPCELCPDGRYSGEIAQAECLGYCPAGTGSEPGSTNSSHCVECDLG
jgi:hypothetical protein